MPAALLTVQDNQLRMSGPGEAIVVRRQSAGSDHHKVTGILSTVSGTPGVGEAAGLGIFTRLLDDGAGIPIRGYSAHIAVTGANQWVVFARVWNAGAWVAAPGTAFVPIARPIGSTSLALQSRGDQHTVELNGTAIIGPFTDATVATGRFGGAYGYEVATSVDLRWGTVGIVSVPDPPGGGVTPPGTLPGTRESMLWPGGPLNPYNEPLHDGIAWNMAKSIAGSGEPLRTNHYGTSVYGAGYTPGAQTDVENHRVTIEAGLTHAHDGYARPGSSYFNDNLGSYDLKQNELVYYPEGACQYPTLFGVIREYDRLQGVIRHAMNIWLQAGDLRLGWVWPAHGQDGDAAAGGSQHYTGIIPIGSRMGIPLSTPKPAGLTAAGSMLWDCARDYGAFVTNRTGNRCLQAETAGGMDAWAATARNSGDAVKVMAAMKFPSGGDGTQINSGQRGGPGARLVALGPPPFAY